jgi:hypothetical protein
MNLEYVVPMKEEKNCAKKFKKTLRESREEFEDVCAEGKETLKRVLY